MTDSARPRLHHRAVPRRHVGHGCLLRVRGHGGHGAAPLHPERARWRRAGDRHQPRRVLRRGHRRPADDRPHRRPLRPPNADGRRCPHRRCRRRGDELRPQHRRAAAPARLHGDRRGRAVRRGGDPHRRPVAVRSPGRGCQLLLPGRVRRARYRAGDRRDRARRRPLPGRVPRLGGGVRDRGADRPGGAEPRRRSGHRRTDRGPPARLPSGGTRAGPGAGLWHRGLRRLHCVPPHARRVTRHAGRRTVRGVQRLVPVDCGCSALGCPSGSGSATR